jgi:hypothetical protein
LQLKLWVVFSYALCIWCLYWIYNDHILLKKALIQGNPLNYFGLLISIVLIIFGTQLEKFNLLKNRMLPKQNIEKKGIQTVQSQYLKEKEEKKQAPQRLMVPPGCKYYPGYLNDRPKMVEIPGECLECENLVICLSSETQIIEKQTTIGNLKDQTNP